MTHYYAKAILVAVGPCMLVAGCSRSSDAEALRKVSSSDPETVLVVWRYPSYPTPDERVIAGAVAVVYADATMIRAESPASIGDSYISGKLDPQAVEEIVGVARARVRSLGSKRTQTVTVDAASTLVRIPSDQGADEVVASLPYEKQHLWISELEARLFEIPLQTPRTAEPPALP